MPATKMTVNLPDFVRQKLKLAPYGNRSSATEISKKIDRYFLIIGEEKKNIKEQFSLAELNQLYEACKNEKFIPAEACTKSLSRLFSKSLETEELRNKLDNLSIIENIALIEVIEELAD